MFNLNEQEVKYIKNSEQSQSQYIVEIQQHTRTDVIDARETALKLRWRIVKDVGFFDTFVKPTLFNKHKFDHFHSLVPSCKNTVPSSSVALDKYFLQSIKTRSILKFILQFSPRKWSI